MDEWKNKESRVDRFVAAHDRADRLVIRVILIGMIIVAAFYIVQVLTS
jgi:hypothetical protein